MLDACTGGELLVRHGNKEQIFEWSDKSAEQAGHSPKKMKLKDTSDASPACTGRIHWAAFYSNCEHELLEVRSGHRLTLTYNLYQTTKPIGRMAYHAASPLDVTQSSFYKDLSAALGNSEFFENGHVLAAGMLSHHTITSVQLAQLMNLQNA